MNFADWRVKGIFNADAQKVYEEICSIGEEVTPQQIVEKAKSQNTELHKCFEWDNQVAGDKWRLHQARNLTVQLVVKPRESENTEEKAPIRLLVKPTNSSGYRPLDLVVKNKTEYEELLQRAYAELNDFKRKYSSLSELDYILSLI